MLDATSSCKSLFEDTFSSDACLVPNIFDYRKSRNDFDNLHVTKQKESG